MIIISGFLLLHILYWPSRHRNRQRCLAAFIDCLNCSLQQSISATREIQPKFEQNNLTNRSRMTHLVHSSFISAVLVQIWRHSAAVSNCRPFPWSPSLGPPKLGSLRFVNRAVVPIHSFMHTVTQKLLFYSVPEEQFYKWLEIVEIVLRCANRIKQMIAEWFHPG